MSGRALSEPRSSVRLAERRRTRRRRAAIAFGVLFVIVCAMVLVGLRQSAVRISHIDVFGADPSLAAVAAGALQGSYLGLIPRDSIFFFPEERIRADILAAHRDIAAISIFRNGLTGLSIKIDSRTPIARWCGLAPTPGVAAYCYVFDASGTIFDALPEFGATSTVQLVNPFTVYAPLEGDTLEPLGARIADANQLPDTFDFARQLATFGSSVNHIVIRDGEVSDYLESGTRITYVLGNEQNAFTALVSARDTFNLTDGSVDYVDLRFDGKVYLKKKE